MSACGKCGHDNPQGGRFCSECGGPLSAACPKCSFAGSPAGSKFCSECGSPLSSATASGGRPALAPPAGGRPAAPPAARPAAPAQASGARPAAPPRPTGRPGAPARPAPAAGAPARPAAPPKSPHVLMRVGAPPLPLVPGQAVTFGREECTLTIPSSRVSRRHAEITWVDGRPVITDLGSSNGTLVGGKRLTKAHTLEDGDEISVGPYLCTYRDQRKGPALAQDPNQLTAPMLADAMAGRLDQVSLLEVLQTLDFNQKTGVLEVFGGDASGSVGIREGKPVYASAEDATGLEAIYLLLRETDGQFTFGPGFDAARAVEVTMPVTAILMEATRRKDEGK